MRMKRLLLLLPLGLVLLLLTACGPRVIEPAAAARADETALVVQLPAMYLDVAADGQITLAEGPLSATLAGLGVDLSDLSMSDETVGKLVSNNIQHIQIDNQPDGLHLFINGNAYPTVVWDDEALDSLVNVLGILGTDLGEAANLLPLLPDLGIGVVLRLPTTGTPIPLATGQRASAGADNTLATALDAPVALDLSLNYAADGSFQLQGLNPFMMGMIPTDALQQSPDTLSGITEMGIESLSILARPIGLVIMINGEPLPYLRSADEEQLLRTIELLLQVAGGDQAAQMGGLVRQILPALWRQGLRLSVNFPA